MHQAISRRKAGLPSRCSLLRLASWRSLSGCTSASSDDEGVAGSDGGGVFLRQFGRAVQVNTQIIMAFDLWFPKQPDQRVLWPSTVRLSHEYFESLGRHAVPLDHRAVPALSGSAMALDAYVWLAQRLHLPSRKPHFVSWAGLHEQFGQGFAHLRDFRRRFLHTLRQVKTTYPDAMLRRMDAA
jgi:hypothetical protein